MRCLILLLALLAVEARDGDGCGSCRLRKFSVNDEIEAVAKSAKLTDAVKGGQCVHIPFAALEQFVKQPKSWCTWNARFGRVENEHLRTGDKLNSQLNIFPAGWKKGEAVLSKVHNEDGFAEYVWGYTHGDVVGRKHLAVGALDDRRSCLMTWERAGAESLQVADVADSFNNAATATLAGARCLELVYSREGKLDHESVKRHCHRYTHNACDKEAHETSHTLPHETFFEKSKHPKHEEL